MRLDIGVHLQVSEEMSSARQSLGRLNDTLSFIPTVMTTSLATAPGTEATGAPAARMAQIEQILEDALNEEERTDIAVQMWAQMDAGPIEEKFNHLAALIQTMVIEHITAIATRSEEFRYLQAAGSVMTIAIAAL